MNMFEQMPFSEKYPVFRKLGGCNLNCVKACS